MDASTFLIIGANGQLGKALQAQYPQATAVDRGVLDITDWRRLESFDWSKYSVILNAAAYTNVDGAETTEGRAAAWKINATGSANLAKIATSYDLTLIHISSDYVFDGTQSPHSEQETYTPLGVYGQSKAAADIVVSMAPKHYILRVTWLIGDGQNFVRTMIGLADRNISPSVVGDQIGRLTFTSTVVAAIDHLLSKGSPSGIYNLGNEGEPASWADITRIIFELLGRSDLTVSDVTTEHYFAEKIAAGAIIASRPLQSTLDLAKIKASGLTLPTWREELRTYITAETTAPKEMTS